MQKQYQSDDECLETKTKHTPLSQVFCHIILGRLTSVSDYRCWHLDRRNCLRSLWELVPVQRMESCPAMTEFASLFIAWHGHRTGLCHTVAGVCELFLVCIFNSRLHQMWFVLVTDSAAWYSPAYFSPSTWTVRVGVRSDVYSSNWCTAGVAGDGLECCTRHAVSQHSLR